MSLQGTVEKNGDEWRVATKYSKHSDPIWITVRWKVLQTHRTGPFAPTLTEGLKVISEQANSWGAYSQGDYLTLVTEHDGVAAETPYPAPAIRKGVESRYQNGRWEKYLQTKGWRPA